MTSNHPIEEEFDDSEDDVHQGFDITKHYPGQIPIAKLLEMYPAPEETSPPEPQLEIIQPIPIPDPPPSPTVIEPETVDIPSQPPIEVKRGRGAPKGNLNAMKHGLYMNNSYISNTTPIERARLCDLNNIIEHVKAYIDKAYQNGQTLKETSQINDTLKAISLASIALSRLLHTHNEYMYTSLPSDLKGDSIEAVTKMLDFYQKKVGTFIDLTSFQSDQGEGM